MTHAEKMLRRAVEIESHLNQLRFKALNAEIDLLKTLLKGLPAAVANEIAAADSKRRN